eukprot:373767_1
MAHFVETSQPEGLESSAMRYEHDSALEAWIAEYRLSKIAPKLYEEDITLEFLLDQTAEEIKEIATDDLKFKGIQLKKFLHAIAKQKSKTEAVIQTPKQEMKEQKEESAVKSMNKAINHISLSDSWYNEIKGNGI